MMYPMTIHAQQKKAKLRLETFEKRLENVMLIRNVSEKIDTLLDSKGFKPHEIKNGRIVDRNGNYIIYRSDTCRLRLIPIVITILEVVGALGGVATLYKIQKLLNKTYMVSNHTIRYKLRQLCDISFVQKKELRNEDDKLIKATYKLIEI